MHDRAMVIWSILTQQAWEELQRKGRLEASVCHVDKDFLAAYTWMVAQMERRLTIPQTIRRYNADLGLVSMVRRPSQTGSSGKRTSTKRKSRYQGRVAGRE